MVATDLISVCETGYAVRVVTLTSSRPLKTVARVSEAFPSFRSRARTSVFCSPFLARMISPPLWSRSLWDFREKQRVKGVRRTVDDVPAATISSSLNGLSRGVRAAWTGVRIGSIVELLGSSCERRHGIVLVVQRPCLARA